MGSDSEPSTEKRAQDAAESRSRTRLTLLLLLAIGAFFLAAMLGFALDNANPKKSTQVFYVFPLLLVGGVVVFMLAAAAVVTVFERAKLTDKRQPFGLPEGTVRAFIATAFIFAFFMLAFFLYYDVAVNNRTGAAADLAKQLTTTLSTLVVAIAAFYFGAASVQSARSKQDNEEDSQKDHCKEKDTEKDKDAKNKDAKNKDANKEKDEDTRHDHADDRDPGRSSTNDEATG